MKFLSRIVAFSVLLIMVSCQTAKNSTATKMLKFNFQPGKSYDYEMITDMDQEIMGQKQELSMTAQYGLDVKDSKDGVFEITTTFNALRMSMQMMGFTLEIDTEKPLVSDTSGKDNPLEMISKMFQSVKGQKFNMKVSAEGRVLEVTGLEEMVRNMLSNIDVPDEMKSGMDTAFKQQFNSDRLREQFERAFFIFPGKEVKVGDKWEKVHGGMNGNGQFTTTYTVDEIEGDMVTLDVKSKFSAAGTGGESMTGKQDGTMVVDSRSGLIMRSDLDLDIEASEGGQKMKMKGKMRIQGRERN
jgi:hypothetical protein